MSLTVNGPASIQWSLNNLNYRQNEMVGSVQCLSSGRRINQAADDAAGLSIAETYTSKIRGLKVAERNVSDLYSALEITESVLDQITGNVQRIRELAVNAANGSLKNEDRSNLQDEVDQLTSENLRLAASAEFNGHRLFNIGYEEYLQIQANEEDIFRLDAEIDNIATLEEDKPALQSQIDALTAANSQILSTSSIVENQDWMTTQIGADEGDTFEYVGSSEIGNLHSVGRGGINVIDISTQAAASEVISTDSSYGGSTFSDDHLAYDLKKLGEIRSKVGAQQNRLDSIISGISTEAEMLTQSRARIMDVDYASETAKQASSSMMLQAGIAMLTQANQHPKMILQLLS